MRRRTLAHHRPHTERVVHRAYRDEGLGPALPQNQEIFRARWSHCKPLTMRPDAIDWHNATPYGLASVVGHGTTARMHRVRACAKSGIVNSADGPRPAHTVRRHETERRGSRGRRRRCAFTEARNVIRL